MTNHLERDLEAYFRIQVRHMGGICEKMAPTVRGMPDRIVILPHGQIFLVELKTERGQLSAIQHVWHQRVAQLGVVVEVLAGRRGVDRWVLEQRRVLRLKADADYHRDAGDVKRLRAMKPVRRPLRTEIWSDEENRWKAITTWGEIDLARANLAERLAQGERARLVNRDTGDEIPVAGIEC